MADLTRLHAWLVELHIDRAVSTTDSDSASRPNSANSPSPNLPSAVPVAKPTLGARAPHTQGCSENVLPACRTTPGSAKHLPRSAVIQGGSPCPFSLWQSHLGVLIFVTRWALTLPGPAANLLAGTRRYPWPSFLLADLAGEALWVAIALLPGFVLGTSGTLSLPLSIAVGALLSLGCLAFSHRAMLVSELATRLPRTISPSGIREYYGGCSLRRFPSCAWPAEVDCRRASPVLPGRYWRARTPTTYSCPRAWRGTSFLKAARNGPHQYGAKL